MRLIFATCSPERAEPILLQLLEERLVGCGNLMAGVASRYWWKGAIERDTETVMWMETTAELAGAAAARLRELHPYEVPKIVVLDPESVDPDYLAWLRSVTR
jgi:periplasmic divalent cation tolerance protein